MRWLTVVGVLLYLTRCNDAGALKCHPGSPQDPQCELEKKELISNLKEQDVTSDEDQCLPGSEWDSNCHRCLCSEQGIAECTEDLSCIAKKLIKYADPILCQPNTTFKIGNGNICTCQENGRALCTPRSRNIEKRDAQQECTPGSSYKQSCNTCYCLPDGTLSCTKLGCLDGKRKRKRAIPEPKNNRLRVKRSVCKPHSEFNVDCNPCKCAADGLSYTCTHNECLEGENTNKEVEVFMETEDGTDHVEQHSVCKPRATFYVNCNTCHCNFLGTEYSCTDKACPLPEDVELFHELKVLTTKPISRVVCVANRMFIKDCNTCWCNEDGTSFFCTRRVCNEVPDDAQDPDVLKLREVRKECSPNEVFAVDCNMCRCGEDGKSFSCTRRACVQLDEKNATSRSIRAASSDVKKCQAGQEFRMDCNTCLCNDEGEDFSCTRNDCTAVNKNGGTDSLSLTKRDTSSAGRVEMDCAPGSVFDRECNVCRCTSDGHHASCTLKICQKSNDVTTASPAFRCTPGDQFRRDCNDCTCSADGKNVFCTLRLCDELLGEITP